MIFRVLLASLLGAALTGWAYEHQLSTMRVAVSEARVIHAQARETIEILQASAVAALKACEEAMPVSVAEQRAEMLEEIRWLSRKQQPNGMGGE